MKKSVLAVVVLGIAAISYLAGRGFGTGRPDGSGPRGGREILYYVDPMNPSFRSGQPGIAPCGMQLEPVYEDSGQFQLSSTASLPPGTLRVTLARQQLIGVKTAPVQTGTMTYTLRLYGKVVPDETRIYRLNASTDSWIRKLSDFTTGSLVDRGQILAEALAPAYYNAQVTFLVALDNLDRIRRQLGGELRHQQGDLADNQIRVAVQALQNLGISDPQVEELANTRKAQPYLQVRAPSAGVVLSRKVTLNQWFRAGDEFFTVADIGRVWVYADVYEDEARHLSPGMKVKVAHAQMGRIFDARISQVLPLFDPISKTLKVRLEVQNADYDLRPDMFVDVQIPITLPPSLHVPADALVDSGTRAIVYVEIGNGAFEPRRVATGWRLGRQVEITGGLMPDEKVVVAGNFLIDSESRMRASASEPEGEVSRDPVCGMDVGVDKAESMGRTARYRDRTFYFCADGCRILFEEGPDKYLAAGRAEAKGDRAGRPAEKGWLGALEAGTAARGPAREAPAQGPNREGIFGTSLTSRGVVDWDGPDPESRDWRGWGKFPGARYLGLGDETLKEYGALRDADDGGPADSRTTAPGPAQEPSRQ